MHLKPSEREALARELKCGYIHGLLWASWARQGSRRGRIYSIVVRKDDGTYIIQKGYFNKGRGKWVHSECRDGRTAKDFDGVAVGIATW